MIVRRTDYFSTLEITAGSNKNFQQTILDSSNNVQDLSDTAIYTSGKFNILEGDFTLIATVDISFIERSLGLIQFFIPDTITTNENAGNWIGETVFSNELSQIISQEYSNFNILQSNNLVEPEPTIESIPEEPEEEEPTIEYDVVWQNTANVLVDGNTITKDNGVTGWGDSGASSVQSLASGDGYVTAILTNNGGTPIIGLSNGDADKNYVEIDFGILPHYSGGLRIHENGVSIGTFGIYNTNDVIKIAIESGIVKYYKNDVLLYTSLNSPIYPVLVDTAFYSVGSVLSDVKVGGGDWV